MAAIDYLKACRPNTLTASFGPVLVGGFLSYRLAFEQADMIYLIPLFISAISIQIVANLFNDYADGIAGRDTDQRLGPMRLTSQGRCSIKSIKYMIYAFSLLALFSGLPIIFRGGVLFLILGIFSLVCAYLYTATSWSLASKGVADFFVIIFFRSIFSLGILLCFNFGFLLISSFSGSSGGIFMQYFIDH